MTCEVCGLPIAVGEFPCISRPRPHERGSGSRIGDECDFYDPNFERRFTSKAEHDRVLKEHGLVRKVRHVGVGGSDKSTFTRRWEAVPTISEADRIAHWHATERQFATTHPQPVALIVPEPEPVFSPDVQRELCEVAARVGL